MSDHRIAAAGLSAAAIRKTWKRTKGAEKRPHPQPYLADHIEMGQVSPPFSAQRGKGDGGIGVNQGTARRAPIKTRWIAYFVPLIVLLLAVGTRFYRLDTQSLWNDEGNSLRLAQRGISDLIDAAGRDIHPPGYYLALKGWIALAGDSEFSLRALSALEGVLAVAVILALGRALFSAPAGWIAGGIVALSPLAIYYSQETRMYAQLGLFSAASMLLLVHWLTAVSYQLSAISKSRRGGKNGDDASPLYLRREKGSRAGRGPLSILNGEGVGGEADLGRASHAPTFKDGAIWALALALCNTGGLYTQYSYAFTLAAQGVIVGLWWLGQRRALRPLIAYIALNLCTLLLFLPWLPTAYDQITTWPRTGIDLALGDQLRVIFTWITYGNTAGAVDWIRFLWPGALILIALWPDRRAKMLPAFWRIMLPLVWAGAVIGTLLVSGAYREANLKFLIPAQHAAALLIGAGAARWWDHKKTGRQRRVSTPFYGKAVLAAGLLIVIITGQILALDNLYHDPAYARDDYRAIAAAIGADPRPGDAVILDAPNQAEVFGYYYHGAAPVYSLPRGLGGDDAQTRADVEAVIRDHRRIFVLFWGEQERDPNRVVQSTLDTGAYPVASEWFGDVRLAQYAVLSGAAEAPQTEINAPFGEAITLQGYALSDSSARPGNVIGVTLFWSTAAPLETRYKVTVQLLKPDGSLAAQHDAEPGGNRALTDSWIPGETVIDLHGLIIPPDLPPGRYTVIVSMYNVNNPDERLSVSLDDTAPGDHLRLAEILLNE